MNIKRSIAKLALKAVGGPSSLAYKRALFQWIGNNTPIFIDSSFDDIICHAYQKNGPFYSVVNKIAKTAARIPTKIVDVTNGTDNKEEVTSGEGYDKLMQVWHNPNALQGNYELQVSLLTWFKMTGNGYFNKVAPTNGLNKGQASELWAMPSNRTIITPSETRQEIQKYNLMWNPDIDIPPELVLHMKMFTPETDFGKFLYGMSPATAILFNITSYNDGNTAKSANYQNGGPRNFMKLSGDFAKSLNEGELDQEGVKAFSDDLIRASGPKNAGRIPFTDYDIEIVKVGDSIVDLGIVETQLNDKDAILDAYETPIELFNSSGAKSSGSMGENRSWLKRSWYEDVIIPLNDHKASELNDWLVQPFAPDGRKWVMEHDYSGIPSLQEDFAKQAAAIKSLWQLTPRMVYSILNKPVPQGMEDDFLDAIYIPINLQKLGDESSLDKEINQLLKEVDGNNHSRKINGDLANN